MDIIGVSLLDIRGFHCWISKGFIFGGRLFHRLVYEKISFFDNSSLKLLNDKVLKEKGNMVGESDLTPIT